MIMIVNIFLLCMPRKLEYQSIKSFITVYLIAYPIILLPYYNCFLAKWTHCSSSILFIDTFRRIALSIFQNVCQNEHRYFRHNMFCVCDHKYNRHPLQSS